MLFAFKLERALHFTRIKETFKKIELANQIRKIEMLKGKRKKLIDEIRILLSKKEEQIDVQWMCYRDDKVIFDRREIEKIENLLKSEEELLSQKKEELNAVVMRRKGLESLREKRKLEFDKVQSKREQKNLDDNYRPRGAV